jgi:signal transduction histidine kinase
MGHDINNMHQVALGYLELAMEMETDEAHKEMLVKPMEVLQRSSLLIKNVRKLQKVHDGSYQNRAIDVCAVLVDVKREYAAMDDKAITLNLNGYADCRIRANELLHDIFSNLVDNAIKHTDDGSKIAIALEKVMLDDGPYYRVSVEDDGPGIPDDHKALLFNRMRKGASKVKGTGLGLYLVRSLVESYNGHVRVEDRVPGDHSKGARFIVLLPAI